MVKQASATLEKTRHQTLIAGRNPRHTGKPWSSRPPPDWRKRGISLYAGRNPRHSSTLALTIVSFHILCFQKHLQAKALLKALMYMILWFNVTPMHVANVVLLHFVTISDATKEYLPGDNKDLLT